MPPEVINALRDRVVIGVLIGLILAGASWAGWMTVSMVDMASKLSLSTIDKYSLTQASEDALREAIANPGHKVPDPRNPGSIIQVERTQ